MLTIPRYLLEHILPTAYAFLPPQFNTREACAQLLAIAFQESGCEHRHQVGGPARSWWGFERGAAAKRSGLAGLLLHRRGGPVLRQVLVGLEYSPTTDVCFEAIEHNDVLAAGAARALLLTVPGQLPGPDDPDEGWRQYLAGWNPGAARDFRAEQTRARWLPNFTEAWRLVDAHRRLPDRIT